MDERIDNIGEFMRGAQLDLSYSRSGILEPSLVEGLGGWFMRRAIPPSRARSRTTERATWMWRNKGQGWPALMDERIDNIGEFMSGLGAHPLRCCLAQWDGQSAPTLKQMLSICERVAPK